MSQREKKLKITITENKDGFIAAIFIANIIPPPPSFPSVNFE